jgi:hypothetical protein
LKAANLGTTCESAIIDSNQRQHQQLKIISQLAEQPSGSSFVVAGFLSAKGPLAMQTGEVLSAWRIPCHHSPTDQDWAL